MTPSGVEQPNHAVSAWDAICVIETMTPSGVEQSRSQAETPALVGDRDDDAFGR